MAGLGLSGLASGVDTSAIVEQLMGLERQGQARLGLRRSAIDSQQGALRDLKAKLDALKAAAADLRVPTTWAETQSVESSDARVAVARIGGAPTGGYTVKVTQLASSAQKTYAWTPPAAATTLDVDGKTVAVAANASAADVAATINGRADLSVYAAVVNEKLILSTRATGAAADFTATGTPLGAPSAEVAGRDAELYVDGVLLQRAGNVVEDAIPGLRLTLKGVTAEAASVVVAAPGVDRAKVKAEVKAFVDAYNALVSATRAKVDEKRIVGAMTTSDYLKGQLFGDTGLNAMLSRLRLGILKDYGAEDLDQLADIGISTGAPGAVSERSKSGLLTLDETKLSAALDADAQGVRQLLGGTSAPAFAQDVEQLAGDFSKLFDGRIESAGSQSKRIADELARADTRLAEKEKRLKAQFAAMEAAMSASQTQMAWLQGQLAGLPTSWT